MILQIVTHSRQFTLLRVKKHLASQYLIIKNDLLGLLIIDTQSFPLFLTWTLAPPLAFLCRAEIVIMVAVSSALCTSHFY